MKKCNEITEDNVFIDGGPDPMYSPPSKVTPHQLAMLESRNRFNFERLSKADVPDAFHSAGCGC